MIRLFTWFGGLPLRAVNRFHARRDRRDPVDALIAEKGVRPDGTRPRHEGFDPDLRKRTDEKRKEAERLKRRAGRIASEPPTERTLRRVL